MPRVTAMPPSVRVPATADDVIDGSIGPLGPLFTQVAILQSGRHVSLDISKLQGGDVLVFSAVARSRIVERYQSLLFESALAPWTHCAILDENCSVWDALPSRSIRSRPLREVIKDRADIAVVRPTKPVDPHRLRTSLIEFSNGSYQVFNIQTANRLAARLVRARFQSMPAADDAETICSLFVVNVLRRACQHGFLKYLPVALPADFLLDPEFTSIDIGWVEVLP